MFEFQKLCSQVEALSPAERGLLIADKAVTVIRGLRELGRADDPVDTLAAFIIGSVVSDGSISEKDFLNIYPGLKEAFGQACDLAGIKSSLMVSRDVQRDIRDYTKALLSVLSAADETLAADIVMLCLLVTSADGKVSLRERNYIRQLCKD